MAKKKSRKQRKIQKQKELRLQQEKMRGKGTVTDVQSSVMDETEMQIATTLEIDYNRFIPGISEVSIDLPQATDDRKSESVQAKRISGSLMHYSGLLYVIGLFLYNEIAFHLVRVGLPNQDLLYKVLFAITGGAIVAGVISLCSNRISKWITFLGTVLVMCYYFAQIIYSGVFATYLSLWGTKDVAGQALDYTNVIMAEVKHDFWRLAIFLLPLLYFVIRGRKKLEFKRGSIGFYGAYVVVVMILSVGNVLWMKQDDSDIYSAYDLYKNYSSVDMSIEKLGVLESFVLDARSGIMDALGLSADQTDFAVESEIEEAEDIQTTESREKVTTEVTEEPIDTSPNVLDLDLEKLAREEDNENVAALHEYISSVKPTNKNEYTGMFEGYNVIFVVAEGFSGYLIDPERTPTLYKLSHDGFCFRNYYTPLWYGSTLGGEFANLTGLMPKNGGYLSMQKIGKNKNNMMFTLGQQLRKRNYKVTAYHANSHTYYERDVSRPVLGYDWVAVGSGYEPERNEHGTALWPQSDLFMVQNTFKDYAGNEPFYTYYLTVSGHVIYSNDGNAMSERHKDLYAGTNYTDTTKAYLACQQELELAMEQLVKDLEDAGLSDRTVIVLTADHVPYDNKEVVDELAGGKLDETFEWYRNTLIIWSGSMEESVRVNKYCSSVDVLPTVSNLLGLPYDSRMMVGQDILSDSEGIVMFNDRSFITDQCSYNANTGDVECVSGKNVTDAYVENKKLYVKNKFSMAESIVDNNYYQYIENALSARPE